MWFHQSSKYSVEKRILRCQRSYQLVNRRNPIVCLCETVHIVSFWFCKEIGLYSGKLFYGQKLLHEKHLF